MVVVCSGGCDGVKNKRIVESRKAVCDANNHGTMLPTSIVLDEAKAKEYRTAFEASGNCDAKLNNPEFRSPGVALKVGGNSKLVIDRGVLEGGTAAIEVGGNAQVELKGTVVLGKIKKSGNAKVIGLETIKKTEEPEPAKAESKP